MKKILFLILICINGINILAGDSLSRFSAGLSLKKFAGFYTMNGVCAEFSNHRIADHKIKIGLNITSSHLGSAFNNNGIPVIASELYARYSFVHEKKLQPFVMLNAGYAKANFGSDHFKNLPDDALLLAPEMGLSYQLPYKIQILGSVAYYLTSGNGIKGPGFIYPVCLQFQAIYGF